MQGRSFVRSILLIVATIAAGLTLRLVRLGFPNAVVKYGGSILWALMIYWFVVAIRPRWPPTRSALVSSVVALNVELFKLHHAPALDAFRLTLPGKLLLGRVFSSWDRSTTRPRFSLASCWIAPFQQPQAHPGRRGYHKARCGSG